MTQREINCWMWLKRHSVGQPAFGQRERMQSRIYIKPWKTQVTESSPEGKLSRDAALRQNRSSTEKEICLCWTKHHLRVEKLSSTEIRRRTNKENAQIIKGINLLYALFVEYMRGNGKADLKEKSRSVRCACSQQPQGREKRFRNILQPVSSQSGSVRVEERRIDAGIVKKWRSSLSSPLKLQQFLFFLQFPVLIGAYKMQPLLLFRSFKLLMTHCGNETAQRIIPVKRNEKNKSAR